MPPTLDGELMLTRPLLAFVVVVPLAVVTMGLASCEVEPELPPVVVAPGVFWAVSAEGATAYSGADEYFIVAEFCRHVVDRRCMCITMQVVDVSTLEGLIEQGAGCVTVL